MTLASAVILSFFIALLRGGKVSAIKGLRFNGMHFLAAAMFLRVLLIVPTLQPLLVSPAFGELDFGGLTYILSLLLVLVALLTNFRLPGFAILTAGMFSNFLVIAANLGQMPAAPDQLMASGYGGPASGHWSKTIVTDPGTPLWFLGDNLLIGRPFPLPTVISIGDVVIALGAFWFFQQAMRPRHSEEAPGSNQ